MSTLTDAFESRYSTQRVLEWTNPDEPNADTKDATRLAAAGADAEARFTVETGVEFDPTDARHLQAAIPGVRVFLLTYLDQGAGEKALAKWVSDHLKPLSMVTGRDRLMPTSASRLIPSTPRAVRPDFDISAFDGLLLDNPSGSGSSSPDLTQSD